MTSDSHEHATDEKPTVRNPSRRKRRGRSAPPVSHASADAFSLEHVIGPRAHFGFLDSDRMQVMQNRVLDLLADYGVMVVHPTAQAALLAAGATEGSSAGRIKMPRALVLEALQATPKSCQLFGKSEAYDMSLPRRDAGFILRTGTGAHGYVDPRDASYRNMDLAAVQEIVAVANTLDQVGFIAHPFVHGVPEVTADIHAYATMTARTQKHMWMQPYQKENIDYLLNIAAIAAGGEDALRQRPSTSTITCSFSPLEFKHMDTEVIIACGKFGVPVHACSLPSAGGTAPLSPAALALMAVAEVVGMVTMAHVLSPSLPVIATPLMFALDMRTGSALQSSVEAMQAASLSIQLVKQGFGLMAHTYGSGSDTPDSDHQSMAERAMLMQTVALSGADVLGGVGQLECATVFCPVQAVLDNELGAMTRRFLKVPDVSDAALNFDEMRQVPVGGHFLDSDHTVAGCRDQLTPDVFQRMGRDDYEASGRKAAFDMARDKALAAIAQAPEQPLLSEDQMQEIAKLQKAADAHIVATYSGSGKVDTI
ncbi:trimethylamine methyltransferase family protein [Shimia sp. R11_0]|uniref:trimethylamine methyltransferase family protein n=1 Tax=Shimia sp. R11_0 TaxID=2821096 RepID=UPI001ADA6D1F|nr:trimethylamine methyltransferase family protein [Shimia sp. R11_0]MBO9477955.1 trimethylamine methyltransferase family protein [Shimia sp. R11_0]